MKTDSDKSFHHWFVDAYPDFIIEEFYPSTPVAAPHLSEDLYDGTIRIPTILAYDQGKIEITFLQCCWKLPPKSLSDKGTLMEKHKSYSQSPEYYSPVDPFTKNAIEYQLNEGLTILYKKLLSQE